MNPRLRDILLFFAGLAGIAHQALFAEHPQAVLIGAFLAMMLGAPVVYRLLERWERK